MLADLRSTVWAFSALRVAAERGVLTAIRGGAHDVASVARTTGIDPAALRRVLDVLAAYGVLETRSADDIALTKEGSELASRGETLAFELTASFGQATALVEDARRGDLGGGWHHVDPEIVRAQARVSIQAMAAILPQMRAAIPALERLSRPGAMFLDVGIGGAGGAIAACRQFPGMRVVGLEPLPIARLEARAAIESAGLADRIEVRPDGIEALREEGVFDVAYVASMFIPEAILEQGLARVFRALAPGGVLLLGAFARPADPRIGATAALRWHTWGGGTRSAKEVGLMVKAAGFASVGEGPVSGDLAPLFAIKSG